MINCEVSLTLTGSKTYVLTDIATQTARNANPNADPPVEARERIDAPTNAAFQITDTKLYVPVVTLPTQDDNKLLKQLHCAPFSTCKTETNDVFVNEANHIYIAMPVYNLIEFSDNYWEASGSLWQFKRDEVLADNADLSIDNFQSSKYKATVVGNTKDVDGGKSFIKDAKTVVPLKYLNNFWRSLEMPLINCKVHLELNWIEDCILSSAGDSAKFKIIDPKLHVPMVTLSTKDNVNLTK